MTSPEQASRGERAIILFPEIIGTAVTAIAIPILLFDMMRSGRILVGIVGFVWWCVALIFVVRLILLRRYTAALIPMLALWGLCLLVVRLS
jgi:hypothetical protein